MANIKGRKALRKQAAGDIEGAKSLYEAALQEGINNPRILLAYAILLLRNDEYEKAKDLLVTKVQKAPGLNAEQKRQMYIDYAVCCYKLGDIERAVSLLDKQCDKGQNSLLYQTLGFILIDTGDYDRALTFNKQAVDYDEDDAICLDNLGQVYYRMQGGDKRKAKEYFDAAIKIKPGQIDTLYFLSLYDIEDGKTEDAVEKLETALEGRFSPLNFAGKDKITELLNSLKADAVQD